MTDGILKRALEECEASTYKIRVGAVIFKGKRILSSGHNEIRMSSTLIKYRQWPNSIHAEVSALLNAPDWNKLKGASILVIKVSKTTKQLSNAMPCEFCYRTLTHIGIKDIYYSDPQGQIVKL